MISVVIPAFNEATSIGDTVRRIRATLEAAQLEPYEIIVVDDGSHDETRKYAAAAGASVVHHPHNSGYGHSLKNGIRYAKYDIIAICDADGTYPVEVLPTLIARYKEGYDMVVGARTGKHYSESLIKMALRGVLRVLVEFTASRAIPDINSGLRVFSRKTVMGYFSHLCNTFSFTTSMTLAYAMTGHFVAYEPIEYNRRIGKSKVKLLRDSLNTIQYILESAIYFNPLRIFMLMSFLVALFSIFSFVLALLTQINVFYYLGIGGVITATVVFTMGLLATLLRQIMVKATPDKDGHANRADE